MLVYSLASTGSSKSSAGFANVVLLWHVVAHIIVEGLFLTLSMSHVSFSFVTFSNIYSRTYVHTPLVCVYRNELHLLIATICPFALRSSPPTGYLLIGGRREGDILIC